MWLSKKEKEKKKTMAFSKDYSVAIYPPFMVIHRDFGIRRNIYHLLLLLSRRKMRKESKSPKKNSCNAAVLASSAS